VQDLHFLKPWESKAKVTFTTVAEGTGTKVTWAMDGDSGGFLGKAMGLVMSMDAMIGKDFEEGLQNLSRVTLERVTREGGAKG
jgi:carbon monoxide dehydrogenase subunit G